MRQASIGIRMHSGWGVVVAVCRGKGSLEVVDRRRITIVTPGPGANQPYHFAATLPCAEAERFLAAAREASQRLAGKEIRQVIATLRDAGCSVAACGLLAASARPLPELSKILAAHPLIHTAEGEFFRDAVRTACEELGLKVTAVREKALDETLRERFATDAAGVVDRVSSLGRLIGPPWTQDEKNAALAAVIVRR